MSFFRRHAVAATWFPVIGCSSKTATPVIGGSLVVSITPDTVPADGVSTVTVTVSGAGTVPVRVTTSRGAFAGSSDAVVSALPATLTLQSCDSASSSACAGTAIVQAVDANLTTAAASVYFSAMPGSGSGPGSGNSGTVGATTITAIASSARIPADGVASAAITATVVDAAATPVAGRTIQFAHGGSGSLRSSSAVTDASGLATVVLVSDANGGTATVTATDTTSGASSKVTIEMPQLGQVNLLSQQYQVQGVRYSGYQEANTVTFQVLDTAGQPYPPGLTVSFSHQSLTGSYLGASASCTQETPSVCSADGVTNAAGQVAVLLTAGRTAGVVSVTASATGGGLAANGTASNLAIVGAKASGAYISLECDPKNVPAFMDDDCSKSFYEGPGATITCKAYFADRFNNVLGIAAQATFASEGGAAGPPATTPQYDPRKAPTEQTGLGVATDFINVAGGALPRDVPPFAGEYWLTYVDACGNLTHNPRDGLVTVIVSANGEEGFVDLNGNGVYDADEPFIDMGEPYVDADDNGRYDVGEYFVDLNRDGLYNGPNGRWDANTVIWAETRVLYTGLPAVGKRDGDEIFSRFYNAGSPPAPTASVRDAGGFSVLGTTSGPIGQIRNLFWTDRNFNPISPTATYAIAPIVGAVTAKFIFTPNTVDNLGMTFTQTYCDKPADQGPTQCSNLCRAAPCYVVTNVGACDLPGRGTCGGFGYGIGAQALVGGACSKASGDTLVATATINGVATSIVSNGTCTP